jgi:hypothetical protein
MTDDELLSPEPASANDGLQARVREESSRLVVRRARLRFAGRIAVPVACFVAGLGVALLRPTPEPRIEYVTVREEVPVPVPAPPPSPPAPVSPAELELQAEQLTVKAEAARLYREAGNRYLREWADHRAALRCYRNFLDLAGPTELVVARDDTWLLTSLKNARELENTQ